MLRHQIRSRLRPAVEQQRAGSRPARADVGQRRHRARLYPCGQHGGPLRPQDDRAQVAARVGRRAHLGGVQRARRAPQGATCSRCCPYPSGEPHIGHLKIYSVGDAIAHFRRRNGHRVLHPMGYDAFGLPAENHAIKTGQHPRESTEASIAEFRRQFRELGHLDRLDARVRHPRAALLPLDAVALPAPVRARPRLPQGGGGQLVSERRRRCSPTSR